MKVMIGIDPHKGSHTAVAIDEHEHPLASLKVRAMSAQATRLLEWAEHFEERTWAVEGAGGLGYLLAQQLLAAGERVLDVSPKLAARVRLLANGNLNKNDPNDAYAVAVAALRSRAPRVVVPEDHVSVLRIWAKRNNDLGRLRNKVACRLHSVLCDLIPGGFPGEIGAGQSTSILDRVQPKNATEAARKELAQELFGDLERLDEQMKASKKRLAEAVAASGSTLTDVYGVGPVVAAMVIGYSGDVRRFATKDHYASYTGTAPIEIASGKRGVHRVSKRGCRQLNHAIHIAAIAQIRHRQSVGRAYYERKVSEGKTGKEAIRALKRRISDAIYRQLLVDAERTEQGKAKRVREGTTGASRKPARPDLTRQTGSSAKPLPDRPRAYDKTPTHPRRTTANHRAGRKLRT